MEENKTVTIWTKENGPESWSKQVFKELGRHDLVRTFLGWYVGSAPGAEDMVLDNSTTSRPDGDKHMTDTQAFSGGMAAAETTRGEDSIYLGDQLAAQARDKGTLYIHTQPEG